MKTKKIEVLAPAGNPAALKAGRVQAHLGRGVQRHLGAGFAQNIKQTHVLDQNAVYGNRTQELAEIERFGKFVIF